MADVERDVLNVHWLPAFADRERRKASRERYNEVPGLLDMAVVGIACLISIALASLGIWKLVELVV